MEPTSPPPAAEWPPVDDRMPDLIEVLSHEGGIL